MVAPLLSADTGRCQHWIRWFSDKRLHSLSMYIQGTSTWGYTMTKYPNYTGDDAYGEVGETVFKRGEEPGDISKKNLRSPRGGGRRLQGRSSDGAERGGMGRK